MCQADVSTTKSSERLREYLKVFEVEPLGKDDIEAIKEAGKKKYYRKYVPAQNE